VGLVTLVYLLTNLAFLLVLSPEQAWLAYHQASYERPNCSWCKNFPVAESYVKF
jgi:hypothetical protein